jgi:hypothetical protein
MCLRIEICREDGGTWSVHGPSLVPVSDLPSLSASIDYARQACNAAPATIELYVDGMYIVAHQERGWPKALVTSDIGTSDIGTSDIGTSDIGTSDIGTSDIGRSRPVPAGPDPGRAAPWSRLVAWLRGPRHSSTAASPAALSKREVSNAASLRLV